MTYLTLYIYVCYTKNLLLHRIASCCLMTIGHPLLSGMRYFVEIQLSRQLHMSGSASEDVVSMSNESDDIGQIRIQNTAYLVKCAD